MKPIDSGDSKRKRKYRMSEYKGMRESEGKGRLTSSIFVRSKGGDSKLMGDRSGEESSTHAKRPVVEE